MISAPNPAVRSSVVWLLIPWAGVVGVVTLTSGGQQADAGAFELCLLCGSRGIADVILNVVLFLPLGMLLGFRYAPWVAVLVGLLVSGGIETTQLLIPGRSSTLSDLVSNSAGAGIGATLPVLSRRWLPGRSWVGRATSLALPALYLVLGGLSQVGVGEDTERIGQGADLEDYDGQVLWAELNGERLPRGAYPGGIPDGGLKEEWSFRGEVVLGTPPSSLMPILRLYDLDATGIMFLGAHRTDLVFRHRNAGVRMGLDYPEARVPDALATFELGDTVRLGARYSSESLCLSVEDQEWCGLGLTPGHSWALLMNLEGASQALRTVLDMMWMSTLFFMVGLLGGKIESMIALTAAAAGVVALAVTATPLVMSPPLEWMGMALGIVVGCLARPVVRRLIDRGPGPTVRDAPVTLE